MTYAHVRPHCLGRLDTFLDLTLICGRRRILSPHHHHRPRHVTRAAVAPRPTQHGVYNVRDIQYRLQPSTLTHLCAELINDHFSGPGREIGPVCVSG